MYKFKTVLPVVLLAFMSFILSGYDNKDKNTKRWPPYTFRVYNMTTGTAIPSVTIDTDTETFTSGTITPGNYLLHGFYEFTTSAVICLNFSSPVTGYIKVKQGNSVIYCYNLINEVYCNFVYPQDPDFFYIEFHSADPC